MSRHAAPVTRQNLVNRYAAVRALSRARAAVVCSQWSIDDLREIVEAAELARTDVAPVGARRSFARSLPTTSLQGQTR